MMTGTLDQQAFSTRLILIYVVLMVLFFMLGLRLYELQVEQGAYFQEQSLNNRLRTVIIPAPRGRIFDREGRILVDNRPRFDLIATPEDVQDPETVATRLAPYLDLERATILRRLTQRTAAVPYEPSTLTTDLPPETVQAVFEIMHLLPGVDLKIVPVRSYQHDDLACHLLGYTGGIPAREWPAYEARNYFKQEEIGREGVEAAYEEILRGKPGGRQIQVDSLGHLDRILGEMPAVKGHDIYLTLDLPLQQTLEEAYRDRSGATVILDIHSGGILAMTSHPGFDPNAFTTGHAEKIGSYMRDRNAPLLNRVIAAEYAPGSIFKPVVALAGLESGLINSDTSFFCNGTFKLGEATWRCWRRWGHSEVNLATSLEQSCNIYYYFIGRELGPDPIVQVANRFRFGQRTGILLQGERAGILSSREWKQNRFREPQNQRWHPGDSINFSIGQGYLLTTPLQMAVFTAALALGDRIPHPRLLRRVTTAQGEDVPIPAEPPHYPLAVNPAHLDLIRQGMNQVVHAKSGTGRKAKVGTLTLAGKTGTAQVRTAKGETKNAWFICYAPFEEPQIAMAILLVDADSGGSDAAPLARRFLARWFGIEIEAAPEVTAITTDMSEPERHVDDSGEPLAPAP